MKRQLTMKERMELLDKCTVTDKAPVLSVLREGTLVEDPDKDRVGVRFDIRKFMKTQMDSQGITGYALAKRLGIPRSNFYRFINGQIPLPTRTIEEMLWLVLPNMTWDIDIDKKED